MHAATAQLDHTGPQTAQAGQIKFVIAVGAAYPLGLRRGEHPIGADHLLTWYITYQEMLTVVVKQINIMAGYGRCKSRSHFGGKDIESQPLCLTHFIKMARPTNLHIALHLQLCQRGNTAALTVCATMRPGGE